MEKTYWIGRKRDAMAMARGAATAESRLIHYELAGRYSIRAAQGPPFMLPANRPAPQDKRETLRIAAPRPLPSPSGRDEGDGR